MTIRALSKAALILFCVTLACGSCTRSDKVARNAENADGESKPLIAVSILPQTWFVTRISGDRARALVLAGSGQNPHSYEPTPRQMRELAQAGVWVLSGAEFEISLLPKIEKSFPALRIVDGTRGVQFRSEANEAASHDDEHGEAHGADRHTWLGLEPAKILAAHTRDALVFIDPAGEKIYNERYDALVEEIDGEFAALRNDLAPLKGSGVFVYHPGFGYFLDEFGIRQEAVESGGKEPGPRELNNLIERARREKAAAVFVQAQFPVHAAKTVADAVGAQIISLDPLAADWLANIRLMGSALRNAAAAKVNE